jgi:beta-lactamase regulating signal transducer with metallopeptidase domain
MRQTMTDAALVLSSSIALSILAKVTVLLALGLTATWLAGRARASRRHLVLAATFAALLALPLVAVLAPAVAIELAASPPADSAAASSAPAPPTAVAAPAPAGAERRAPTSASPWAPSLASVARGIWMVGAALLLGSLGVDLWRLRRMRRDGLPSLELGRLTRALADEGGVRRPVEVLLHEEIAAPLTCGVRRPAILLPADTAEGNDADLRRAIVHELEHVRRGDWAVQVMARAAAALYWFHPLAWVAWRRLRLEAERAADDAVVRTTERTEYAEQLVSLARRMGSGHARHALGMANRSDLSARVTALLDASQRRGRAGLAAAASVACAACLLVVAIAPVRAVARVAPQEEPGTRVQMTPEGPRTTPLDEALYEAARSGEAADVERLLAAGANVNAAIDGDGSPLIGAAREGRLDIVRLLVSRGADVNLAVSGDGNPLIAAAREGHSDVVAFLLDSGARIDEMVPDDENALIQASGEGHLDVVKLLVSRGADVNARVFVDSTFNRPNGEWRSPLSMARRGRHAAVVAYLQSAGARE